ncbi:MAG: hypothetical protein QXP36_05965 [Conexivisphaerales archaeon]
MVKTKNLERLEKVQSKMVKAVNIISVLLLVGIFVLAFVSPVLADTTDTIIDNVKNVLKNVASIGGGVIGGIGLIDVIVGVATEDTQRRTRGIIMAIGGGILIGLAAVVDSLIKKAT